VCKRKSSSATSPSLAAIRIGFAWYLPIRFMAAHFIRAWLSISVNKRAIPIARAADYNRCANTDISACTLPCATTLPPLVSRKYSTKWTELESARSYLTGVFSLGVATQEGLLGQLSTIYLDRLPEDHLETYRQKVHALTADDVLAATRHHFDSPNAQIILVGDRAQIADQAALFGEVAEYDAQGNRV
jgi:hypothetical protein